MVTWRNVEACPVCGKAGQLDVSHYDAEIGAPINMFFCANCETVYHNPVMSDQSMAKYYSSGAYRKINEKDENGEKNRAIRNFEFIKSVLPSSPGRCLDVGCARGHLISMLRDGYKAETVGFDLYQAPDAVHEIVSDKKQITGKFDLITCIHVLEHTREPQKELDWMVSLLSDNGTLVIEMPTVRKIIISHPVIFSEKAIDMMLAKAGLAKYAQLIPENRHIAIFFAKRVPTPKESTPEFYDEIYRHTPSKWDDPGRDKIAEQVIEKAGLTPESIMDIGCGNGHTLKHLSTVYKDARLFGVDLSSEAIKVAKERIPQALFMQGDFGELMLPEVDLVVVMGVAEHFYDLKRFFFNLSYVCRYAYIESPNCLRYSDSQEEGFRQTFNGAGQTEWHLKRGSWVNRFSEYFDIIISVYGTTCTTEYIWLLKSKARN